MSYLMVPSLKTKRSWIERRIPLSTGSTARSREMSPFTPFTRVTWFSRIPRRSRAAVYSARRSTGTRCPEVVGMPHWGQRSGDSRLQRGQRKTGSVGVPHSQRFRNVVFLQEGHLRSPAMISITPSVWEKPPAFFTMVFVDLASWKDRLLPPASPRGKREWGGGLISRGLDFPGLPILPPMRVPARGRIRKPDWCMASSRPEADEGAPPPAGRRSRPTVRPRQARRTRGCRICIFPSRTWWGTRSSSRMAFASGSSGTSSIPFFMDPFPSIFPARDLTWSAVMSSQGYVKAGWR